MTRPKKVTLIEVGPRDGLQNEQHFVPTDKKIEFINRLSETGLTHIEVTSFVSHKAIPQLTDSIEVYDKIQKTPGVAYSALVPNQHGLELALKQHIQHIALFTAASESFNQRNIHCSIQQSIERFKPVVDLAKKHDITIRAYISCVLGCPYEGMIMPEQVCEVIHQLLPFEIDEISFGDTIGVGTPLQTIDLLNTIQPLWPKDATAMHFHDTYGQAIANIFASLEMGIHRFDSAVAGLGGCPYALGATGNVATEDVLYLMHGLHIETGVDIYKVAEIGDFICKTLKRRNLSKVANALLGGGEHREF